MEYVTLNNGIKMPLLGYGVFQVSQEECERCGLVLCPEVSVRQGHGGGGLGTWVRSCSLTRKSANSLNKNPSGHV